MIAGVLLAVAFQATAMAPDWQPIGKNDAGDVWVDANTISGPPDHRRVVIRQMIGTDGSFGVADTFIDCLAKRATVVGVRITDASGNLTTERTFTPDKRPSRDYSQDADAQAFDTILCRRVS